MIAIDGSFLVAAANIESPSWASSVLVIAAVLNVPVFIASLFILQTKFRPQIQDDEYFSRYLENENIRNDFGNLSLTIDQQSLEKIRSIKESREEK